jgi:hypothetical protein
MNIPVPILALFAATAGAPSLAAQPASIGYETTPCFGRCPVYRITVNANGRGVFEGIHHNPVQGRRNFRITPAQYRAFVQRLAPLRPARGSIAYDQATRCQGAGMPPTDNASIVVRWTDRARPGQTLRFYLGCPNRQIRRTLEDARRLLPLAPFIGAR